MNKLLTRILWSRKRKWQFITAGLGFLLGLLMIMLAVQVFTDIRKALHRGADSEYLIVSKKVTVKSTLSFITSAPTVSLNERDLNGLRSQSFIKDITPITTNTFDLYTNLANLLQVEGFFDIVFESVPDRFLDTIPPGWQWREGQTTIPVLLSKQMLDVYNFNAALLYELPQVSLELLQALEFRILVTRGSNRMELNGRIVGLTHRMPTLAVPHDFLLWANDRYGKSEAVVSKVMIEVDDPGNMDLRKYLSENSFETNLDRLRSDSRFKYVRLISGLVSITGLLFTGLSLVIFMLTLQLLISRSQEEVRLLITLGYTPGSLSRNLLVNFMLVMLLIAAITFTFFVLLVMIIQGTLAPLGVERGPGPMAMLAGLMVIVITLIMNYVSVNIGLRRMMS